MLFRVIRFLEGLFRVFCFCVQFLFCVSKGFCQGLKGVWVNLGKQWEFP